MTELGAFMCESGNMSSIGTAMYVVGWMIVGSWLYMLWSMAR